MKSTIFLRTPRASVRCCPIIKSMEKQDDKHFSVKLRVGISHIRGDAKVKMDAAEADRPIARVYEGKGEVAGGTATLTAGFRSRTKRPTARK